MNNFICYLDECMLPSDSDVDAQRCPPKPTLLEKFRQTGCSYTEFASGIRDIVEELS